MQEDGLQGVLSISVGLSGLLLLVLEGRFLFYYFSERFRDTLNCHEYYTSFFLFGFRDQYCPQGLVALQESESFG